MQIEHIYRDISRIAPIGRCSDVKKFFEILLLPQILVF